MSRIKVGLVFGGCSPEHTVSIMSAASVREAIDKNKYELVPMGITREGYWLNTEKSERVLQRECEFVDDILSSKEKNEDPETKTAVPESFEGDDQVLFSPEVVSLILGKNLDVVFPVLHGPFGEDGKMQGFWEILGIPYVGTGVLSSALIMDKVFQKQLFEYHGLPQADFLVFRRHQMEGNGDKGDTFFGEVIADITDKLGFPCFVKPANMGSSIGISRVTEPEELREAFELAFKYDRKLVVEENIVGREVECSVLGGNFNGGQYRVSQPGEIKPAHDYYDYQSKYEDQATELMIPASLPEDIINRLQQLAVKSFAVMDGYGMCRVDFFYREQEGTVFVNELNTIPGFTQYSMYPKLWSVSGIEYSDLISELIALALKKK